MCWQGVQTSYRLVHLRAISEGIWLHSYAGGLVYLYFSYLGTYSLVITVETASFDCSLIYEACVFVIGLPTVLFAVLLCIFTVLIGVTFLYRIHYHVLEWRFLRYCTLVGISIALACLIFVLLVCIHNRSSYWAFSAAANRSAHGLKVNPGFEVVDSRPGWGFLVTVNFIGKASLIRQHAPARPRTE